MLEWVFFSSTNGSRKDETTGGVPTNAGWSGGLEFLNVLNELDQTMGGWINEDPREGAQGLHFHGLLIQRIRGNRVVPDPIPAVTDSMATFRCFRPSTGSDLVTIGTGRAVPCVP